MNKIYIPQMYTKGMIMEPQGSKLDSFVLSFVFLCG